MLVDDSSLKNISEIVFGIRFSIIVDGKKTTIFEEYFNDLESRDATFLNKQESMFNTLENGDKYKSYCGTWKDGYCFYPSNSIGIVEKFTTRISYVAPRDLDVPKFMIPKNNMDLRVENE